MSVVIELVKRLLVKPAQRAFKVGHVPINRLLYKESLSSIKDGCLEINPSEQTSVSFTFVDNVNDSSFRNTVSGKMVS